jgi:hypothetical protein
MRTHFTEGIETWAAVDVIQPALAGTGDAAIPVEKRGTPDRTVRGRQRASDDMSAHVKLRARLAGERQSGTITTDGIAALGRQRAQSDGFRAPARPFVRSPPRYWPTCRRGLLRPVARGLTRFPLRRRSLALFML